MFVLEKEDTQFFSSVQRRNLARQYGLLTDCIEIDLAKGPAPVDKYLLWALNHAAVANISQFGGRFRREPVYVGSHVPPHFREVDAWVDRCISTIQENWLIWSPTELAAYGLWRMNWIHPFVEGNGRTARAFCYYLLCVRAGSLCPGSPILPERITADRDGYMSALAAADTAWEDGHLDFTAMESFLAELVKAQLQDLLGGT